MSSDLISEYDPSDESTEEKKEVPIKMSKEFHENVVKFVKLEETMKLKQKEMSELREKKKICEEYIIKHLESINQTEINISNGKIKKNKSETKGGINQDLIKAVLSKKIGDPMVVEELLKNIEDIRPTNSRVNLKLAKANDKPAKKAKKAK